LIWNFHDEVLWPSWHCCGNFKVVTQTFATVKFVLIFTWKRTLLFYCFYHLFNYIIIYYVWLCNFRREMRRTQKRWGQNSSSGRARLRRGEMTRRTRTKETLERVLSQRPTFAPCSKAWTNRPTTESSLGRGQKSTDLSWVVHPHYHFHINRGSLYILPS
jgi:hypothetical protein